MDGMVTLTVAENFIDGNLREQFEKLGYPAFWKAGKARTIPRELALRAKQSGAQLEPVEDGMPEDRLIVESPPDITPMAEAVDRMVRKYEKETWTEVIFTSGFSDGGLSVEFAALDRPTELGFGVHEIAKLPASFLERIDMSGAEVSTETELIEQFSGSLHQARFEHPLEAWRAEQAQEKEAELARARLDAYNAKYWEEIEIVSAKYVVAQPGGKHKQALWDRLQELHARVK